MVKNYLLTALRVLLRRPLQSVIHLIGLSTAVAACFLIFNYLRHEWSYDQFHEASDRSFLVLLRFTHEGEENINSTVSAKMVDAIGESLPMFERFVRIADGWVSPVRDDLPFPAQGLYADAGFFKLFDFPLLRGEAGAVLNDPTGVVINRSMAQKIFGREDVLGLALPINIQGERHQFTVSGVMEDLPDNTFLPSIVGKCEIILPFSVLRKQMASMEEQNDWGMTFSYTLAETREGVDPVAAEAALQNLVEQVEDYGRESTEVHSYELQPITKRYLALHNPRNHPTSTTPTGSFVLIGIGLVIALIACINFTTLTIGGSFGRAREVGVRKVMGANSRQVGTLFWVEIGMLSALSALFGIGLALLANPLFNEIVQSNIALRFDGISLLALGVLWALLLLVSGIYPTQVLSRFETINAMRGSVQVGGRGYLRRSLVFFQLFTSVALISVTLLMREQLSHMLNLDLGYKGDQILRINAFNRDYSGKQAVERLAVKLAGEPSVLAVAGSANSPGSGLIWFSWDDDGVTHEDFRANTVNGDFVDVMGLEIVQGRDYSEEIPSDADRAILVNETLVDHFGWANPIGQRLPGKFRDHEVIGVVKDYHFEPLTEEIHPLVIAQNVQIVFSVPLQCGWQNYVTVQEALVKLRSEDLASGVNRVKEAWLEVAPDFGFDSIFLDEEVQKFYEEQRRWDRTITMASILAMLIATLGLLGIANLQVAQRTREIGIRKALGAGEGSLVLLLSHEVIWLVICASLLAAPLAWWIGTLWLDQFAYRISISPLPMLLSMLLALTVALFTAGLLAWRASRMNPVKTLRAER
ncbi:ABC transporter permease [bacterium]|nr:ABC transporter permease [bacterium]